MSGTSSRMFYMAFYGDSALQTISFPALDNLKCQSAFFGAFEYCTSLSSVSFGGLKSDSFGNYNAQFNSMLMGCTNVTVHFPSNLESVIGTWTSVTSGFGGSNTTVLFDLPATS